MLEKNCRKCEHNWITPEETNPRNNPPTYSMLWVVGYMHALEWYPVTYPSTSTTHRFGTWVPWSTHLNTLLMHTLALFLMSLRSSSKIEGAWKGSNQLPLGEAQIPASTARRTEQKRTHKKKTVQINDALYSMTLISRAQFDGAKKRKKDTQASTI